MSTTRSNGRITSTSRPDWVTDLALTHSFLIIGGAGTLVSLCLISLFASITPEALVSGVVISLILITTFALLRWGQEWLAPRFLIASIWIYLTLLTTYLGGLAAPAFSVFTLLILASGLLLGKRWALLTGILTILTATLFFVIDNRIGAPLDNRNYIVSRWTINVIVPAVSSVLIFYALSKIQSTSARLVESAERLRVQASILESMSEAVISTDLDLFIQTWNDQAETMYGWRADDVIGRPFRQVIPSFGGEDMQQEIQTHLSASGYWRGEVVHKRRDGSLMDIMSSITLMRDEQDNPIGIVRVNRDISKRKRAERALQQSERRFRTLVEQSPISTVVYASSGRPIQFNQAAVDLWRMTPEELTYIKEHYNLLTDEQHVEMGTMPSIQRGFAGEVVRVPAMTYDIGRQHDNASEQSNALHIRGYMYPITNESGDVEEVVVMHEDVSEMVRADEALRQAQKLESLAVMSGGIAHDFNNLLTAMMAQASLVRKKMEDKVAAVGHLDKVIQAAERAASLTRQLLVYSGRGQFEIRPVNLNSVIEDNAHLLGVVLPANVILSTQLSESLPDIEADTVQIQQLVMNLIINGGEACVDGRGSIAISTEQMTLNQDDALFFSHTGEPIAAGEYVLLTVEDDGIGMDEQTLARIFDPYFSTKETGRGLGMAAALGIVRSHKGDLSISSAPGQGTSIQIIFPALPEQADSDGKPESPAEDVSLSGLVLVIDDEEPIRDAIEDILTMQGLQCQTFANGDLGIAALRRQRDEFKLAIVDLKMPGLSGEETCRGLLDIRPELPIIVSSGYSAPDVNQSLTKMGVSDFLQKPYSFDVLVERVVSLLT